MGRGSAQALAVGAFFFLPVAVLSSQGLTLLLVLLGLGSLIVSRQPSLLLGAGRAVPVLLGLVVAVAVITSGWAVSPADALRLSASLAVLFVLILVLLGSAHQATAMQRNRLGTWLVAGFAVGSAILAMELAADLPLANLLRGPRPGEDDLERSLLNPALTVLVLMAWPIGFVVWRREKWAVALVALAVISVLSLGDSVTVWVAAAASVAAFGIVSAFGGRGARGLGIATVIAVLAAPLFPQLVTPERMEQALEGVRPSAIHRIYTWEFTAQRIFEKPLIGWGLDSSRNIPGGDLLVVENGPALSLHPHNGGLQVWLELGALGALALAALLWFTGRTMGKLSRSSQAPAAATFVAAFVIVSLSFGIWQNWWIAALGMTAVIAAGVFGDPPASSDPA
jgi:exopolysaccharide production protein ExoQ